ncbi:MAG: SufD family Fe-S cluster assembly protein [Caulobacterales bacterium]
MSAIRAIKPSGGEQMLLKTLDSLGACGASAAALVRESGLPNRRVEEWRWSDLRSAVDSDTPIVSLHDHAHEPAPAVTPSDAPIIRELAEALSLDDSEGLDTGGLHERDGQANRVVAVKSGHTVLIERINAARGLSAGSLNAMVRGGKLTRVLIQDGSSDSIVLNRADVVVGPGGAYEQFVLSFGGKLARLETNVSLWGGGQLTLNAAYLVSGGRHCDLTSIVTAEGPGRNAEVQGANCNQVIKGVARAGGRGVFQGKILVQRAAQKTDARQHHQALLLEDGAEIFAKPELQIYADDVQCAHGNAIGALDDDALFYIRSRGVAEIEARAMLIEAFLTEAIPESLSDELCTEIVDRMNAWLAEKSA